MAEVAQKEEERGSAVEIRLEPNRGMWNLDDFNSHFQGMFVKGGN